VGLAVGGARGDVQAGEPLREAENRPSPGQPAGHRQRGDRPGAVQPFGEDLRAGEVPGGVCELAAQRLQPGLQGGDDVQGDSDLQLPGRRQVRGRGVPQRG